jgi:hypothetical protein
MPTRSTISTCAFPISQEVREHVVVGKPRASRDQPAAFGSSQQGI